MPRLVGINHVALEVGDIERALEFYGEIFELGAVEREPGMAFIDMGDQFLALSEGRSDPRDRDRHFGLVVDDKAQAREALEWAGVEVSPGRRLNFRDPWGNQVQVVDYREIQFTKAPEVLAALGLSDIRKTPEAIGELREKGSAGTEAAIASRAASSGRSNFDLPKGRPGVPGEARRPVAGRAAAGHGVPVPGPGERGDGQVEIGVAAEQAVLDCAGEDRSQALAPGGDDALAIELHQLGIGSLQEHRRRERDAVRAADPAPEGVELGDEVGTGILGRRPQPSL
jgi:lactoylglutathione lyase